MNQQCIPEELLAKSSKILFITHLAIGDFTYLQTYFKAFAVKYPHIKIDIWVDEVRRSWRWWEWPYLKNYSLYDWLEASSFVNKIYRETYSPVGYNKSVKQAQKEQYPLVVSLATVRVPSYVSLARKIVPYGFVTSFSEPLQWYQWYKRWQMSKSNVVIQEVPLEVQRDIHITDYYAWWFEQLFNIHVALQDRRPLVVLPKDWLVASKLQFLKYGIDKKTKPFGKVYFINTYAKNEKRSWPIEKAIELVSALQQDDTFCDVTFLINVIPEIYAKSACCIKKLLPNNVILFSARDNFFQLPATISLCDLVISVETSVMHLASAVKVPVIALMRQKNPEWVPWDRELSHVIFAKNRADWIKAIPVDTVVKMVKEVCG